METYEVREQATQAANEASECLKRRDFLMARAFLARGDKLLAEYGDTHVDESEFWFELYSCAAAARRDGGLDHALKCLRRAIARV